MPWRASAEAKRVESMGGSSCLVRADERRGALGLGAEIGGDEGGERLSERGRLRRAEGGLEAALRRGPALPRRGEARGPFGGDAEDAAAAVLRVDGYGDQPVALERAEVPAERGAVHH